MKTSQGVDEKGSWGVLGGSSIVRDPVGCSLGLSWPGPFSGGLNHCPRVVGGLGQAGPYDIA